MYVSVCVFVRVCVYRFCRRRQDLEVTFVSKTNVISLWIEDFYKKTGSNYIFDFIMILTSTDIIKSRTKKGYKLP